MKINFLLLLLLPVMLYSSEPDKESDKYGIDTFRKGNINFYKVNENNSKNYLLDSGNIINSRLFLKDGDSRFYLRTKGENVVNVEGKNTTIKWRTENLNIFEIFTDNGVGYDYTIRLENRSDRERSVGALIVYDTFLGEKNGNHFVVNGDKIVDRQHSYRGKDIPKTILSRDEIGRSVEFIMPEELTKYPDNLILGNWDRLAYSKKWPYQPSENSLFSYGLYSINDSAIGLFYGGRYVKSGESVEFSYIIKILDKELAKVESSNDQKAEDITAKDENSKKWVQEDITEVNSDAVEPKIITEEINGRIVPDETVENIIITEVSKDKVESDDITEIDNEIVEPIVDDELENDKIESENEFVISEEDIINEVEVTEPVNDNKTIILDGKEPSEEDMQIMLDYINKKRNGEDVSGYNFDEEYIMRVLEGTDE